MRRIDKKNAGGRIRNAERHESASVRSFLEIVPIAYVKKLTARRINMSFSSKESSMLFKAPPQSIAGIIAAKKAVAVLAAAVFGVRMNLRDISLTHSSTGSPRLLPTISRVRAHIPGWKTIRLSISHTATLAFGLAAISIKECVHA
jgi:phosphopantetheinyl transferase (holo-ACP synthase)